MREMRCWFAVLACGVMGCGLFKSEQALPHDAAIDGVDIDAPVDAAVDASDVGGPCNALTQAGCNAGEKCAWFQDTSTPIPLGHIGCAPDGMIAPGSACSYGPVGPSGYDNCTKGNVCIGKCRQICDLNDGAPSCGSGYSCVPHPYFFDVGSGATAGTCDKTCNPLDDNDFDGPGPNVRPGSACASVEGCYGFPGTKNPTRFTCRGEFHKTLVHRSACTVPAGCASDSMHAYVNGCAQGYVPVLVDSTGSTQIDCIAMCKPVDCYAGAGKCGASAGANLPGASPHRCNPVDALGTFNVATAGAIGVNGDQCMYSWVLEHDGSGHHIPSPTSDTVGFCVDHSKYLYDSNGNGMLDGSDAAWPKCDQLGISSGFDAAYFGCVSTTTATANGHPPAIDVKLAEFPRVPYYSVRSK
jgi:hypothetical protein